MNLPYHPSLRSLYAAVLGVLAFGALGLMVSGCGDSDSAGLFPTGPTGELSIVVECGEKLAAQPAVTPSDQDCIQYEYARRVLRFKHINTAFNCCPDIEAGVTVRGDSILVNEHEPRGGCHCLCLYDLVYEIRGLKPGTYRVIVTQEYLAETDEPLEFTIDLKAAARGKYCVERNHYPWGE
jgi:hypothetical protein